jgi:type VI secretion system protein ImpL
MFAFLKRTFVILLGFALIVLFIWYVGPYFAFARWRPLETEFARLVAIGIVVGCWLIARLVKRLRAYRASDRLLAAVVAQPQPEPARPPAEVVKLRERFDEAVAALKQQRRSGHSLYDLPWYVIIGAPGSGKTTALLNSGLKFPLEQRVGKGALRGVGGTRNCDWWFTDEAIFLDTAGRYTTQDSDAASDSVGWSEFLALLRKYRARRPVNGVILTINAQDLIVQGAAAREAHVEAARNRLEELNRELRIQLPVYLMVTKCDLVDGFAEYFDDLTVEGRAQVWGVTFPYEQTVANETAPTFPAEFDALATRLNERVYLRLEEVRDTRRRTKVFGFPQQMTTVREALTQFVTEVFDNRNFTGQILLRGVYFTSGTQEGTPIDRLLGSIGRRFGATAAVMAPSGPGKAYFVESLLKDVMIGESGLAGINRRLEARKAAVQLGAYVAAGLIAAACVAALSVSYNRNNTFLEQIDADINTFEQVPSVTPSSSFDRIVPKLDAIKAVVDTSDRYRESTSWLVSWGLYQGASIGNAARGAYLRELDTILLPRVATLIRARMIQYSSQSERLYLYLKAYLMLGEPKRLDKEYLQALADLEWNNVGPQASVVGPALSKHFEWLLTNADPLRPLPMENTLVGQARSSIKQTSMSKILYDGIKRRRADPPGQGLRVDQLAGLDVEKVFKRKSGVPLSAPLPSLYSRPVFLEITGSGRAELVKQLQEDSWVWGDTLASSIGSVGSLVAGVTNLYELEYIGAWDKFLDDLEFVPHRSVGETNVALRILTSPSSPLRGILRVVRDQTALADTTKPAAPTGVLSGTKKKIEETLGGISKSLGDPIGLPPGTPGLLVTTQFQWVRQLTEGELGKTQLDAILATLGEIQRQFDTLGPEIGGASTVQILANPSFRTQMQTLRQQAATLPSGLRTLVTEIAAAPEDSVRSDATDEIEQLYEQQVLPGCRTLIANKYPFASVGMQDVQLADFAQVFAYDGLFDRFFKEHLEKLVDTSRDPWAWRPGAVSPKRRLLDQFQAAQRLRELFFPPGAKNPEVQFTVTMTDLDPNATRFILQIDGQNFDDAHQPPVRKQAVWPGKAGQVVVAFEGRFFDPSRPYGGPWAWFRMIDETMEGAPDAQQRIRLKVQNPHHSVYVTVEAARAGNSPFALRAWRQFSCES